MSPLLAWPLLFVTGLVAGFVDSIAGGGGLITVPMLLLTAPRGLLNQPQPLLPAAAVADKCARIPNLAHREIADTNHYSILTGSGRTAVAAEIDRFVAALPPRRG